MKEMIYKSKREIEILDKGTYNGMEYVIVSYGVHPCAYVKLPKDSKYYGKDYYDCDVVDNVVHGGLTFSGSLKHIGFDDTEFWYGWDYSHCGDYSGYPPLQFATDKKWHTDEILEHVKAAIDVLVQEK